MSTPCRVLSIKIPLTYTARVGSQTRESEVLGEESKTVTNISVFKESMVLSIC